MHTITYQRDYLGEDSVISCRQEGEIKNCTYSETHKHLEPDDFKGQAQQHSNGHK